MGINWLVRLKNPYFIIGLLALIITVFAPTLNEADTWFDLFEIMGIALSSPIQFIAGAIAVVGYFNDPTSKGLTDSKVALTFDKPFDDKTDNLQDCIQKLNELGE